MANKHAFSTMSIVATLCAGVLLFSPVRSNAETAARWDNDFFQPPIPEETTGGPAGYIVGWGSNGYGQTNALARNSYVAVAAGGDYSLALKSDGSIIGWGYNYHGETNVPAGNSHMAIAAGRYHSLALKSDGSIVGWGDNYYGQISFPAGNNYVAIAAGYRHSLALKSDGSIIGWGDSGAGAINVPAGNNYVAIAAGMWHSLALKSDGSIVGWGYNGEGQTNVPKGNGYVAIAAGAGHSLALVTGPWITKISSKTSKPGSTATVYGRNFSTDKAKDLMYFGKKKATVNRAKTTNLRVTIPSRCKKGTVGVRVVVNGQTSNTVPFQVR